VRPVAPQRFAVDDLFFSSARNLPGGLFFDRRQGSGDVSKSSLGDGSKDENQNEMTHHRVFGVCQSGDEHPARARDGVYGLDCIPEWMNCLRKIPGGFDATEGLGIGLDSAA